MAACGDGFGEEGKTRTSIAVGILTDSHDCSGLKDIHNIEGVTGCRSFGLNYEATADRLRLRG
ncbi:MAG: hypothetical protein CMM07_22635 [Rhodopirellula sp.]|nr:hypothetical protein [Rhodopirellula sp.]